MMASGICFHCGAPVPRGVTITGTDGGELLSFCCRGCHGAWLLINGAGLGDFYRKRECLESGFGAAAFENSYSAYQLAKHLYAAGDLSGIDIIIDGIRCASCVWLNEKVIGRLEGVTEVRLNYATGRARVLFDPVAITPVMIFERIAELGYLPRPYTRSAAQQSAERDKRDLLLRFGTAFFLTMQLMAYSFALYAGYFQGMEEGMKASLQYFSLLVTTPVLFYSGLPFLKGAWRGIVNRAPGMELLIATGALSSYVYSVYATVAGGEVYYETAAMIITLVLAGRLLENRARRHAASGVERLLNLTTGQAQRFSAGELETVDIADLRSGDTILVGVGERIPADGRIVEGETDVDESPVSGEPLPLLKQSGDSLSAGSINLTGTIRVLCDRPASESFIARVARLVEAAQSRRAPVQGVADRVSAIFVPVVLLSGVVTFWWQYAESAQLAGSLMTALAVIVIACPCALGLATPTAILAGTGAAAAGGVIFKGGDILERMSGITVALFDKTGTVTCGKPIVNSIMTISGVDSAQALYLAAAVESGTRHPIGAAIYAHALALGITAPPGEQLKTVAGGGVSGLVDGEEIAVGNASFLAALGIGNIPEFVAEAGSTVVHIARSGVCIATLTLTDRLLDEALPLMEYFRGTGISTRLISGDSQQTATHIADALRMDDATGGVSPADKAGYLENLRSCGEVVLMAGDGINDAPAIAAADVGCAVAGGTDIALETSDLVLVKPGLGRLAFAHRISRKTMRIVRQNLGWAFIYNIIGIPLAISGQLTPVYAAAAMALSSLCVVLNSLRITRLKHE